MLNRSKGAAVWVSRVIFRFGLGWSCQRHRTRAGDDVKAGEFLLGIWSLNPESDRYCLILTYPVGV